MSSCSCIQQALYCVHCCKLPTNIFAKVVCPTHSSGQQTSSKYVTFFLASDVVISGSENLDKWPITYHGTTVEVVRSVLEHGLLMKAGDILHNGATIKVRHAKSDQPTAIWTYPTQDGAEKAAAYGTYDEGLTKFKALIRVRQMPGTYSEHPKQGFGHDVWSTQRRGTHYIEAIDVLVVNAKGTVAFSPLVVSPKSYITNFTCLVQKQAFAILELLKLPKSLFDSSHNRCYCPNCYPDSWPNSVQVAGETYAIPRGWTRFGLAVNPALAEINDIWNSWQIAFHGCHPNNVLSIAKNRTLLIPHDILPDGKKLQVWSSADPNQKCYFLSPAIGYSAHPWYAKPVPFTDLDGKRKYFQMVFVLKVNSVYNYYCWQLLSVNFPIYLCSFGPLGLRRYAYSGVNLAGILGDAG